MKKAFLLILLIGSVKCSNAQERGFGVEAGLNLATINAKIDGYTVPTGFSYGARAGVLLDFGFSNHVYLQPGIFYAMNGTVLNTGSISTAGIPSEYTSYLAGLSGSENITVNSIEIPVSIIFKTGHPGGYRFFVGAGGFLSYNISASGTYNGQSETINIGSAANDQLAALNFGVLGSMGFQIPFGLYFRSQYEYGLANVAPGSGVTENTLNYTFSIGYMFGEKGGDSKGIYYLY
jgi:Outer membrane protein beta-barrel domain